MSFTAKDVQMLRERTACGMMDCKKALTEAGGDMDKAIELLREKGLAAAAKKASRIAAEGIVLAVTEGNKGVVLEVNAETDFVSKNADFKAFVEGTAQVILDKKPADVAALLELSYDDKYTVAETLREKILTIGENMNIRRFELYEGNVVAYVHGGGRIGVLVDLAGSATSNPGFVEVAKDIAMQIAALNPTYLDRTQVSADVVEKEKEILVAQIKNDPKNANKPANIIEKMVEGRIGKFFEASCLVDQPFVKDGSMTVGQYVASKAKEFGGDLSIARFVRYEKGEGLQKREDNFADEIAKMVK